MSRTSSHAVIPYGAFELKVFYQRNMLRGILFAALLVVVFVVGTYVYKALTAEDTVYVQPTVIKTIADLGPPPTVAKKPPTIQIEQPKMAAPKVGIPKPVADDEAPDQSVVIASREELADIVAPDVSSDVDQGKSDIVVSIPDEEYLPTPEEFVPVEIQAEMIYEAPLEYPRLTKQAGMEGVVWVKALVDKNGDVVKAVVGKSSGSTAGFDEAAVAQALKCKYKPAIQNGRPVAVWVTYKVEFNLRDAGK